MTEHPQRRLISVDTGGFRLECPDATIVAKPGNGLTVSGGMTADGWRIKAADDGLRLERADGGTAGRVLRTPGADGASATDTSLLLDDGRLFRVVLAGPRDARFELRGWETRGAYFEARPTDDGWSIEATAAGGGIERSDAEQLLILFAAAIDGSERELG